MTHALSDCNKQFSIDIYWWVFSNRLFGINNFMSGIEEGIGKGNDKLNIHHICRKKLGLLVLLRGKIIRSRPSCRICVWRNCHRPRLDPVTLSQLIVFHEMKWMDKLRVNCRSIKVICVSNRRELVSSRCVMHKYLNIYKFGTLLC